MTRARLLARIGPLAVSFGCPDPRSQAWLMVDFAEEDAALSQAC